MTVPVPIAIFGSCVTRDVFNRRFCPDYKDLFDCVLLANQVSMLSAVDDPIELSAAELEDIDKSARDQVAAEAGRDFWGQLAELQPDYLIIDLFADVHFGAAELGDRMVTRNRWRITKTKFYTERLTRELPPDSPDYYGLFVAAADRFFARVRDLTPRTKIVLHEARNISQWRGEDGAMHDYKPAQAVEMNERWQRMDGYLRKNHADRVIDIFTPETISFEKHPWGPFFVHYTLDYHARFLSKLSRITLLDREPAASTSF